MDSDATPHIVVMGASAGGVQALPAVVSALPAKLGAPVFVVLHTLATVDGLLPQLLGGESALPAAILRNEMSRKAAEREEHARVIRSLLRNGAE